MNERQLAELLRLVEEPEGLDADAHRFKERLRVELEDTLHAGGASGRPRLVVSVPASSEARRRRPTAWLAVAAAITLIVLGAALVVGRTPGDAPADQPATTLTVPATTMPVLHPDEACARFRASAAFGLLVDLPPTEYSPADLADVAEAVDVLLVDVEAVEANGSLATSLRTARGAVNEARLLLEAGDLPGAEQAISFARVELSTTDAPAAFAPCLR